MRGHGGEGDERRERKASRDASAQQQMDSRALPTDEAPCLDDARRVGALPLVGGLADHQRQHVLIVQPWLVRRT